MDRDRARKETVKVIILNVKYGIGTCLLQNPIGKVL